MTYEEAVQALGPDAVRRADEFVASLPPLTPEQAERVAAILRAPDVEQHDQRPAA